MGEYVTYRYRVYPNVKQRALLTKTFGCVRYYWNLQVEAFNAYDKKSNPHPVFCTSTQVRRDVPWMGEVSAAAIQQKENDFKQYKTQFFNKPRKERIGNPSFKKRSGRQSYRLPNQKFSIKDSKIRLEKTGWVKMVVDRDIPEYAKLMSVTVSKNPSGQYFASVLVEQEIKQLNKTGYDVGIDVGLKEFLVQSDGIVVANPRIFRENQAKLKRMQQHLSRKQNGSKRRDKCKLKVARLHQKVSNQRKWFLHNESTRIVRDYDVIAIEDLNIAGMLKNRKLAKSISDVSWSAFFTMLKYKSEWYGKELVKIDRFSPSSKTCSACGYIRQDLQLSVREWTCPECYVQHDRDENAAKNIKAMGANIAQRTQSDGKTMNHMASCDEAFSLN